MRDIQEILEKLLADAQAENIDLIDVDVMIDDTRRLYTLFHSYRSYLINNEQAVIHNHTAPEIKPPVAPVIIAAPKKEDPIPEPVKPPAPVAVREEAEEQKEVVAEKSSHILEMPVNEDYDDTDDPITNVWIHPASAIQIIKHEEETRDVRKLIGINDKYQLMSELFGNNKEAYEDIMSELNTFNTFKEATDWLNVFIHDQYRWDDDSESVMLLYSILSNFLPDR